MKKKFKVLKYGNIFVDYSKLSEGIYGIEIPTLYNIDATIEEFINNSNIIFESIKWMSFDELVEEKQLIKIENLSKCKLVEVELTEI